MEPEFLTLEDVLFIHENQIQQYGGSPDLRDRGLLISAIETPSVTFDGKFLHGDLLEMAAAYLFHIVKNHPFVDGNKRTGVVAALTFLDWNNIEVEVTDDELAEHVLSIAQGEIEKHEVTEFLKLHAVT